MIVKIIAIRYDNQYIVFKLTDRISRYEWNSGLKLSILISIIREETEIIFDEFIVVNETLHEQRVINHRKI